MGTKENRDKQMTRDDILLNHLNSWGTNSVDCGVLLIRGDVISWMHRVSVLVRKLTLLKFVLVDDVNSWGRATNEYHEN